MKAHNLNNFYIKKKKMVILNNKLETILPELMNRNLKLMDRVRNKLKVSSFFNNIEERNKKYLRNFIFSSDKRIKDLKTGVQINNAIKQSSEVMSVLCNQMDNDIIIKHSRQLLKEKQLVKEKTEQETHNKIEELLNNLRTAIRNPKEKKEEIDNKEEKSFTAKEINEVKDYIGDKIKNEEMKTNNKISNYLRKLNYIFKTIEEKNNEKNNKNDDEEEGIRKIHLKIKKALNKLSENFYIKKNIKLINYSKPKPFQIQDKEGANLKRIKNCLYPSPLDKIIQEKDEKDNLNESDISLQTQTILSSDSNSNNKDDENKLNKNSSLSYIRSSIQPDSDFYEGNKEEDELNMIKTAGKDTLEVLNSLATQGKYLSEKFDKKFEKINSLIDLNLPYPKNYELILNYSKFQNSPNVKNKYISFYPKTTKIKKIFGSRNDGNRSLPHINNNMKRKLASLKEDIANKKFEKNMFDSMFSYYIGFSNKNLKKKIIKLKRNIKPKKMINHKISMDNILQKKRGTVFITLKKLRDEESYKTRKTMSCNIKKKNK